MAEKGIARVKRLRVREFSEGGGYVPSIRVAGKWLGDGRCGVLS